MINYDVSDLRLAMTNTINNLEPTKYCKRCEFITPWDESRNCIFCLWNNEEAKDKEWRNGY